MTVVVGRRVRSLREGMGLSLRDLSARCGVSAPMLSQVERGETSPTLQVAERIAAGLDLSLSQLLRLDEAPPVAFVRQGSARRLERGGHAWEHLTPELPGQRAAVARHRLEPGAATGDDPLHEPGSREFALVEQGPLTLHLDGVEYTLVAGDAVTFDADLPHRFHAGEAPAVFLSVLVAGLRRS
jgi:XRE family transcriptional regulator, regulator of sulfur utilization